MNAGARPLPRRLAAELLGTFVLVFFGAGAIVVDGTSGGALGHVGIALVFGAVVFALIQALGDVSGAHLNPAVTLAFVVAKRFPRREAFAYAIAQCAGALIASFALRALFEHPTLGATHAAGSDARAFVLEAVATAFLVLVVLAVSQGAKERGLLAGLAIGAVVTLEALCIGPITGASMNPARSLGPAVASGAVHDLWIYLAAPMLAAVAAVPACRSMREAPCCTGGVDAC